MYKEISTKNKQEALFYLRKELYKRQSIFWQQKNGSFINIKAMSDEHLLNTINLLENLIDEEEIVNTDSFNIY